jgi:hypothetical protein
MRDPEPDLIRFRIDRKPSRKTKIERRFLTQDHARPPSLASEEFSIRHGLSTENLLLIIISLIVTYSKMISVGF